MSEESNQSSFFVDKTISFGEAKQILDEVEDAEVVFENYISDSTEGKGLRSGEVSPKEAKRYLDYLESRDMDYLLDTPDVLMPIGDFGEMNAEIVIPYEPDSQSLTYNIMIEAESDASDEPMTTLLNIGGTLKQNLTSEEARNYLEQQYSQEKIQEGMLI